MSSADSPNSFTATGGEWVVQSLLAQGIERLYCVPGESYLAVIDALYDVRDQITQITCRHESGAAMMALAEAELSQQPSVCFVTRGPGATNASIAMHMAQQASVPLVLGIGQVASGFQGRDSFQEMDYTRFFDGVCKSVTNITEVAQIPEVMHNAFECAAAGRAGPVAVVFPEDILRQTACLNGYEAPPANEAVLSPDMINDPLDKLAAAEKPLIIAGGPLWPDTASSQLTRLAETLRIPVLTAFRRNDVVDNFSDCFAGYLGLNQFAKVADTVAAADCIVVLGPRLDEPTTGEYRLPTVNLADPAKQWIHIYPDFSALQNPPQATQRIERSATDWLASAFKTVSDPQPAVSPQRESWYQSCSQTCTNAFNDSFDGKYAPDLIDLPRLMNEFDALLPEDAIVTTDAGNFTLWPQRLRRYRRPGRLLAPINGAMGFGVPSGIAASLAHPERTVVSFVGDGGFIDGLVYRGAQAHGVISGVLGGRCGHCGPVVL